MFFGSYNVKIWRRRHSGSRVPRCCSEKRDLKCCVLGPHGCQCLQNFPPCSHVDLFSPHAFQSPQARVGRGNFTEVTTAVVQIIYFVSFSCKQHTKCFSMDTFYQITLWSLMYIFTVSQDDLTKNMRQLSLAIS